MDTRTTLTRLGSLVAAVLLVAGCSEAVGPAPTGSGAKELAITAATMAGPGGSAGITLDQQNGSLNESGQQLAKGFDPRNPHLGDAIIATVYWVGSTNIVDSVIDFVADANNTRVGNQYQLVEYVTAGGYSMATYVATNAQNFPDTSTTSGRILAVRAYLHTAVTDGGIGISAWTGVNAVAAQAVGAHRSASGSAPADITTVGPGPIAIGDGALAYAVTMSNGLAGRDWPQGFTRIGTGSDAVVANETDYAVQTGIGSVDPKWTWYFGTPSTWLTTVLALNPPLHLGFAVQPSTTLPLVAIQPAVQVTVLDALGNRATTFNGSVTIAIGHNGGLLAAGTLSGTRTVTAVNGVATFSDLSIDQPGNGYTLVVSASSVFGAESTPFNIGAF
jgi:hypothetical protein